MTTVSKDTMKRVLSDVKQIMRNPLHDNGIYYKHDDENALIGYAMIVGPEDTPYQYGYYLFEISFPVDYPHSPLSFAFKTADGETRFHPNFYRSGKCCVSILNTWKGEQWTSCQTLSSVLLTISSLFDANPILNEPGVSRSHADYKNYHDVIAYKNMEVSIISILEDTHKFSYITDVFTEEIRDNFEKNKDKIEQFLDKHKEDSPVYIETNLYRLRSLIDYESIYYRFVKLK